jgi:hypothetical protein
MNSFGFLLGLLVLLIGVPAVLLWLLIRTISRERKPKISTQRGTYV